MSKNVCVSLGNSMFMAWEDLDVVLDRWAKGYFGEHVEAVGSRDETSFEVEFTGFLHSDFEKYAVIFEKYDVERDFEPEDEFAVGHQAAIWPADVSRRLMLEVLSEHGMSFIGTAVAVYDGVFFMEKDVFKEKEAALSEELQGTVEEIIVGARDRTGDSQAIKQEFKMDMV